MQSVRQKLRDAVGYDDRYSLDDKIRVNPILWGWGQYFRIGNAPRHFKKVLPLGRPIWAIPGGAGRFLAFVRSLRVLCRDDALLHVVIKVKGHRREDAREKKVARGTR